MKFFACFKKMNKLGAAMVEYAVILAFVAAVGSSFTEGFNPAFNNIIKSVSSVLGLAANGTETKQSAKDIAFSLFNDPEMNKIGDKRWESFGREIASGGNKYIEDYYFNKNGLDTAYSIVGAYVWSKNPPGPADAGLAVDGGKNYKLITVADKNGVSCAMGNLNDDSTHFSATQYLLCEKNGKMNLVATRELSNVCITKEGNHPNNADPGKGEPKYSLNNNFSGAQYKEVDKTNNSTKWVDITNISSGFVKYEPK